jgi:two-component system NarL family sensor kinase
VSVSDDRHVIETGTPLISKEEGDESISGEAHWVLTTKLPWYDENGDIIGLFGVSREITERRRVEQALRESEQKFRALYLSMPVPVYTWQRSGKDFVLVDHNDAADAITGGRMSDYLGTTARAMYPGRPDILEDMSRCYAEKISIQKEMVYRFKTTEEDKTLVVKYAYVPPDLVLVHTEDITERKQVEQALRKSEQAYRNLVEKISDVIYAIDTAGVTTYVSPAIESFLGFTVEQVVGQPFARFLAPEDLGQSKDSFQVLMSGVSPGPAEYRVRTSSGETRWMRVSSQPIVDGGRVAGVQGVLTDITERKRVEEQLEAAATAAERQRLARELHDSVTQRLYSLDLYANATQEALSRGRIETGAEHAGRIRALSQSALADMRLLIFELRPPLLEQEGLAGALRARLEMVEGRVGLKTEFEAVAERPLSSSVEAELYAVAREALNNALKHAQADQITVKLEYDEERCTLTIQDDGCGFDPANGERGGGFGLSNMRERVERIGGNLTLDTAPGRGTTVRVEVTA